MSAELESLRELPPQPNQDAAVRLTDDQLENWIVAFGEWQFVLACEAVKRSLPGKRGFKSLYTYLADHLKIPRGTATDLAQRVNVALELTSDSGTSAAAEVDSLLTREDVRELNRNPAAREEIKERIKGGSEPQEAIADAQREHGEDGTATMQRRNSGNTPLNYTVKKQHKAVEALLATIEGAVQGLLSIDAFHPETPREQLDDWLTRISNAHRDVGIIPDLHTVKNRMKERTE